MESGSIKLKMPPTPLTGSNTDVLIAAEVVSNFSNIFTRYTPSDTREAAEARLAGLEKFLNPRGLCTAGIHAAEASAQQMKAAARASQAEYEFAVNEHHRLRRLLASKHVAKEQVDAAATRETATRAAFESAQFAEQAAQFQLEMSRAVLLTSNDEASVRHLTITAPVVPYFLRRRLKIYCNGRKICD